MDTQQPSYVPCYFPKFYWKFRLSDSVNPSPPEPTVHIYEVYENVLSETTEIPTQHHSVFHDFNHNIDPATRDVLDAAEVAFSDLENHVEGTLVEIIAQLHTRPGIKAVQVAQRALDNLRKYFSFLRFRNCEAFKALIRFIRESGVHHDTTPCGALYSAYHPLISQLQLRVILRTVLEFLTPDGSAQVKCNTERHYTSTPLLRHFHDAMDSFCWTLRNSEICFGLAADDQEFLLPDACYGTLADGFKENPDCCDLIFPILPKLAIYLLGNVDEEAEESVVDSLGIATIPVGTECAIDVHLRNAMVLNSYPERLYFSSLRAITLTLSAYDEFRWIQEHQDYSRLKNRCRQKFLQSCVTKTLVIKGTITLLDLTDEIELTGESPIGFGAFSDVWKGVWKDRVEQRVKPVAVKYLRKVMFDNVQGQLMKRLQSECAAWYRLCHRHVNQLYGLLQTSQSIGMVCQWCENGTITEYIKKNPAADKMKLLVQVASGMAYLHSCQPVVVHGDLKGGNILIDQYGCALISDFGLSKIMEGMVEQIGSSFFAGSTRWMAPELIRSLVEDDGGSPPVTTYSDVFAFGAVCLEVITGQLPYPHRTNDHGVLIDILRGVRPCRGVVSKGISTSIKNEDGFWAMLDRCWDDSRRSRPTMQEMVGFLKSVVVQL